MMWCKNHGSASFFCLSFLSPFTKKMVIVLGGGWVALGLCIIKGTQRDFQGDIRVFNYCLSP